LIPAPKLAFSNIIVAKQFAILAIEKEIDSIGICHMVATVK
jgi:hypothetical protein